MRLLQLHPRPLPLLVTGLLLASGAAHAEIHGVLEAPDGYASEVSNVQGWVYTDTPGAELVQPFDAFLDGVKVQQVPCCSDRGDVQDANPGAPVRTGFSGVINWAREALAADGPVVLSVVVRDTAGGELVLEKTLDLYAMMVFPFSQSVRFEDVDGGANVGVGRAGVPSRCTLRNVPGPGQDVVAQLECTHLVGRKSGGIEDTCAGNVRFTWERASQGFKQSSSCEEVERWTDNGDGTATDRDTGLTWELKSGEPGAAVTCSGPGDAPSCANPHHVNNRYTWSRGGSTRPDGSAFTTFLGLLNDGFSEDGESIDGCFAGHCDWRLPTIEELTSIESSSIPGGSAPFWYLAGTYDPEGNEVWYAASDDSIYGTSPKHLTFAARAVRGTAARRDGPAGVDRR